MKTISFELSKKLNDLGLLDNIETEYCYAESGMIFTKKEIGDRKDFYKTLTFEEAIEFLPEYVIINDNYYSLVKMKYSYSLYDLEKKDYYKYENNKYAIFKGNQIEQIEKMLDFLLKNNLLTK